MNRFGRHGALFAAVLTLLGVIIPVSAVAASRLVNTGSGSGGSTSKSKSGQGGAGTLRLTLKAPDGVPATVLVTGKTSKVASKPPAGTQTVVTLAVPEGEYRLAPQNVISAGRLYAGRSNQSEVRVRRGAATDVAVGYAAVLGARDLHADTIDTTKISMTWTAENASAATTSKVGGQKQSSVKATQFLVRRARGSSAVTDPGGGLPVAVTGTTATDSGLRSGRQYTYSLFWRTQHGWSGPLTLIAAPAPAAGSKQAAYVLAPGALLASASDVASIQTTGTGVTVAFKQSKALQLGSAVVLPVSTQLAGGFLGTVATISDDGRTVGLVPGALGDAFDYYSLDVPEYAFTVTPDSATTPAGGATPAAQKAATPAIQKAAAAPAVQEAAAAPVASDQPKEIPPSERHPLTEAEAAATAKKPSNAAAASTAQKQAAQKLAAPLAAAAAKTKCSDTQDLTLTFTPSIAVNGHFNAKLDKYKTLFGDVPKGASLDMSASATATGALAAKASSAGSCTISLKEAFVQLSTAPVPLGLTFKPSATVNYAASIEVSNVGVEVTAGFGLKGNMGITSGANFSGTTDVKATPLEPKITAKGSVGVRLEGDLVVGPGAGSSNAGVIVGIGGVFSPLDATFSTVGEITPSQPSFCVKTEAKATLDLSVKAKAWLGSWSKEESIPIDALAQTLEYSGSPWTLPKDCDKPTGNPSDNVLGGGVTKVDDSTSGDPSQVGYVSGFVPGKTTWVLSTGTVAAAVGTPSTFASSDLGLPGDADLTALAGHPTYDAVAYKVNLVPTGSNLHVKYVFASEEYPEFVGSVYNDAMEVLVNGKNCGVVPGTTSPVSVNTVNATTNTSYFVDNLTGAAGYGTTMDGLTVPLECTVPVTPGVPTTVEIKVADSSDRIYDSAVALLDQGIWSDSAAAAA
jgi:hypothetical protein